MESTIKCEETDFEVVEEVPVYKGCKKYKNNEDRRACMSRKVTKLIVKNYNVRLAKDIGLEEGLAKIIVNFKIDSKGNITNIKATGPHPKLEKEAERVIGLMPQMKPGYHRGEPVIVPYSIPINFMVENKKKRKS